MALLAPSIMTTTTSTYLQLDEVKENNHIFLHGKSNDTANVITYENIIQEEEQQGALIHSEAKSKPQHQHQEPKQSVLLIKGIREQYTLVTDHAIPSILHKGEILVKVVAIGLNPIDWKAPAFNFGIPSLPWINGRDLAGIVVKTSEESTPRLRVGDTVLVPSTDYRDIRKAAFQEYAIATHFNAARIPESIPVHASASLGVAFVASALALGVSFGLNFGGVEGVPGPDFVNILKGIKEDGGDGDSIPEDIWSECFEGKEEWERVKRGDWVVIWGASTTTGYITLQLSKLAGLKVICVADVARHGKKLLQAGADLLVDRHNPDRAIEIIRGVTGGKLRYAIDIVGRDTARLLQGALWDTITPTTTTTTGSTQDGDTNNDIEAPHTLHTPRSHLLGLTGLPKDQDRNPNFHYHTVPIKLFHSSPVVGEKLVTWLEKLLDSGKLKLPETVQAEGGLRGINAALEQLRDGRVSGKRIVVGL